MAPHYVVHRGGAALWPENSLTAFRNSLALGARILELDVHLTADGEVAVIHDPTLERTTDGRGPIAHCTAAELKRARLRDAGGALTDDCVPLLDEVLALARPTGVTLLIEVKTPGPAVRYERRGDRVVAAPGARYDGLEQRVLGLLEAGGLAQRSFIMAFNPAVLREIRTLAPRQPTALLVDREHVVESGARTTEPVQWALEVRASFLGLHHTLCDAGLMEAARRAGIAVGVFTVNDEDAMRRLAGFGVDVIISDRADLVARLQAEA
jgi:glycerophosphoryl diester phosphodiesterase